MAEPISILPMSVAPMDNTRVDNTQSDPQTINLYSKKGVLDLLPGKAGRLSRFVSNVILPLQIYDEYGPAGFVGPLSSQLERDKDYYTKKELRIRKPIYGAIDAIGTGLIAKGHIPWYIGLGLRNAVADDFAQHIRNAEKEKKEELRFKRKMENLMREKDAKNNHDDSNK